MHFLNTEIIIAKIVAAVNVPQGTGKRIHKNRPSHGLAYNYGGNSYFQFQDGTAIVLHAGECIYLPKASDYVVDHESDGSGQPAGCVAVNFDLTAPVHAAPFKVKISNHQQIMTLFQTIIRDWKHKPPACRERCLSALYGILAILQESHCARYVSAKAQALLQPATDYIREYHTSETIPAGLLAQKCGISESYLRKLFQRVYGMSPMEYARQQRLVSAREYLDSGEYTVSAAAELSGFRDISYFSREFKKMFHITPAAYLKNSQSAR